VRLEKELEGRGLSVSPETLEATIIETFQKDYPGWTDENLLCRPAKASQFAAKIRLLVDEPGFPTNVVLQTLINLRKRSKVEREPSR
jgi:hypothetical protein